jgi:hypothetical protein
MNDQFTVFCPQCDIEIGGGNHDDAIRIANEHERKSIGQHKPEIIGKQSQPKRS